MESFPHGPGWFEVSWYCELPPSLRFFNSSPKPLSKPDLNSVWVLERKHMMILPTNEIQKSMVKFVFWMNNKYISISLNISAHTSRLKNIYFYSSILDFNWFEAHCIFFPTFWVFCDSLSNDEFLKAIWNDESLFWTWERNLKHPEELDHVGLFVTGLAYSYQE